MTPPAAAAAAPKVRRSDRLWNAAAAGLFALGLGVASVLIPFKALEVGYGATQIGLAVAASALAQVAARGVVAPWVRRLPARRFVALAGLLSGASCALAVMASHASALVAAMVLQGASRALLLIGCYGQVVLTTTSAASGLATVNTVTGIGLLLGPALAGVLTEVGSLDTALAGTAALGVLIVLPALLLVPVRPGPASAVGRPARGAPGRRRRGRAGNAGNAAAAVAGAWAGLMASHVPVLLAGQGQSPARVGLLVSVANAAALLGAAAAGLHGRRGGGRQAVTGWLVKSAIAAAGLGTAATGVLSGSPVAVTACLAAGGLGAGLLQTLGPVLAIDGVEGASRSEAVATSATFRAGAMFAAPAGVSLGAAVTPLAWALVAAGLVMAGAAGAAARLTRGDRS